MYLFKQGNYAKPIKNLYILFKEELDKWKKYIFYKYYYLPITLDDLETVKYFAIYNAMWDYSEFSRVRIFDYIIQRYIWEIHRYIQKLLSKKNFILNSYSRDFDIYLDKNHTEDQFLEIAKYDFLEWLTIQISEILSPFERQVYNYWIKGYNINIISQKLEISYKQTDNAIQRLVGKAKDICQKYRYLYYN